MKRSILFLFALIAGFEALAMYPISPRPLRQLIQESEFIISGHVIDITENKRRNDEFGQTHTAKIRIREMLQGSIREEIVEVKFDAYMICPAPPRFEVNTDVIVFLNKDDGNYETVALAYGLKTLELSEIEEYKARIKEMQQIMTVRDENEQFMQTVEWLVKCAEAPATRWEGTFELSPTSDFMSYYSRTERQPFYQMLTKEQKGRLKVALLAGNDGYVDFGLVDLVYADYKREVHDYLLEGLKNVDAKRLWFADAYMSRLLYDNNSTELKQLAENFKKMQYERGREDELKEMINSFVTLVQR